MMRPTRARSAAALALAYALTACGAAVESSGNDKDETASGGSATNNSGNAGTSSGWPAGASDLASSPADSDESDRVCPQHEPLNSQTFSSITDKQRAMIGRWIQCSQQGIGPEDAAGLEITANGEYTVLIRNSEGELIPGVGVRYEGRVEITPTSVNFVQPGISEQSSLLFSDEVPYRMYAFNTDFIGYDYIR